MQQQALLTGVTPTCVIRAAAVAVGAGTEPEKLFGETGQRRGRPPGDHFLMGRRLALYSLHREHGYSLRELARTVNRNHSAIRKAVSHVEQAMTAGDPTIRRDLAVMARLVTAWAASPPPAEDAA